MTSTITADRQTNTISHSLHNRKICCVRCNASKYKFNNFGKREIKDTMDFKQDDNIDFLD